ncbi:hypothetical protein GGE07_004950 [Sinorhizobium terangae]|nr:hypothetical protein [Sinorhizobium terangae]
MFHRGTFFSAGRFRVETRTEDMTEGVLNDTV